MVKKLPGRLFWLLVAIGFTGGCSELPIGGQAAESAALEPPLVAPAPANPVALRTGHPQRYTVVPGDTLWDVATHFLDDPWRWNDVWVSNAELDEPDSLYAGDVIEVQYDDDQPQLHLAASGERPTIRLSPQVRVEYISKPIPTIPREAILPFFDHSLVLSKTEQDQAPYIIGNADGRVAMAKEATFFARGGEFDASLYRVYRPGGEYRDPGTGESLGYGMIYIGEAVLQQDDDPAVLRLTNTRQEANIGDRLLPAPRNVALFELAPRAAPEGTDGYIVDTLTDVNKVVLGRYVNVAVSVGDVDSMRPGHVLAIYQPSTDLRDPVTGEKITLAEERIGLVMIYKVFDRMSLGLVTESQREIRINDRVREP